LYPTKYHKNRTTVITKITGITW